MPHDHRSFYVRRALTEHAFALAPDRQNFRELHEDLARQFDALVQNAQLRPKEPTPVWDRQRARATANFALAPERTVAFVLTPSVARRFISANCEVRFD